MRREKSEESKLKLLKDAGMSSEERDDERQFEPGVLFQPEMAAPVEGSGRPRGGGLDGGNANRALGFPNQSNPIGTSGPSGLF